MVPAVTSRVISCARPQPYGTISGDNPLYLRSEGGARVLAEVAPHSDVERARVIASSRYDAFANYDALTGRSVLRDLLEAHGIDTLLLAGCPFPP